MHAGDGAGLGRREGEGADVTDPRPCCVWCEHARPPDGFERIRCWCEQIPVVCMRKLREVSANGLCDWFQWANLDDPPEKGR